MKLRAAKKDFRNEKVLRVGYCGLQYLLRYADPFAYSAGVYGWACDYYNIDGVYISTGYSPIGESLEHETVKKYEDEARKILLDDSNSYEEKKEKVNNLLNELVQEFKKTF